MSIPNINAKRPSPAAAEWMRKRIKELEEAETIALAYPHLKARYDEAQNIIAQVWPMVRGVDDNPLLESDAYLVDAVFKRLGEMRRENDSIGSQNAALSLMVRDIRRLLPEDKQEGHLPHLVKEHLESLRTELRGTVQARDDFYERNGELQQRLTEAEAKAALYRDSTNALGGMVKNQSRGASASENTYSGDALEEDLPRGLLSDILLNPKTPVWLALISAGFAFWAGWLTRGGVK